MMVYGSSRRAGREQLLSLIVFCIVRSLPDETSKGGQRHTLSKQKETMMIKGGVFRI